MFTGIIEEIGTIAKVVSRAKSSRITIKAHAIFSDLKLGDSVAVNGVCLTVNEMTTHSFTADVMHETIKHTSLVGLTKATKVNLERAMAADGRFGGHIVSGHIDSTGIIREIKQDDNALIYTIAAKPDILKYVVKKGSIAIDGVSLTVVDVDDAHFWVSIIPHTLHETVLAYRKSGNIVNLEVDILAKYIEKLMHPQGVNESKITTDFLLKNGFITNDES